MRRMPQGGVWRRRGRWYWVAQLPIQAASDVRVTDLLNTLYNLGRGQDFLISILPQQPNEGQVLSFWGTLAEEENAVRFEKVQRQGSPVPYACGSALQVEEEFASFGLGLLAVLTCAALFSLRTARSCRRIPMSNVDNQ